MDDMWLKHLNERIPLPDARAQAQARRRWNAVAKPIGSFGLLEDALARIAALTGSADINLSRRAVVVACADNGVVAEGVSQSGPEVTRIICEAIGKGCSSINALAQAARAEVRAFDFGCIERASGPGVIDRRMRAGTGNIAYEPALARDEAKRAFLSGCAVARDLAAEGFRIAVAGEMGIANTTTAAAVACALLGLAPEEAVGRGAGLSDEALAHKAAVVARALAVNQPDACDALDVIAKVGGLDIAALAGLFAGGALARMPIVIDGAISAAAALVAARLVPHSSTCMLASHLSAEPMAQALLDALELRAPLQAGLRLGEGTGGACLLPLLDLACGLYESTTFAEAGIAPYDPACPTTYRPPAKHGCAPLEGAPSVDGSRM